MCAATQINVPTHHTTTCLVGCHQHSHTKEAHRLKVATYELRDNSANDITSDIGLLLGVKLALRLKVSGLLWSGTPCSSWTFLNRGTSKRSHCAPLGDVGCSSVASSNLIVTRMALLCMLAVARSATWAMEQPGSSLMPQHPRLRRLQELGPP